MSPLRLSADCNKIKAALRHKGMIPIFTTLYNTLIAEIAARMKKVHPEAACPGLEQINT